MEDCWIKDSCSKCVADVNCGWCAVTKTCMEGVIMGPLSSNCSAWDYAFCSGTFQRLPSSGFWLPSCVCRRVANFLIVG